MLVMSNPSAKVPKFSKDKVISIQNFKGIMPTGSCQGAMWYL